MKAQDESISKVLDWFSRRSDSFDDQLPSIGILESSKPSPQHITFGDKLEDNTFEPEVNENEVSQKINSINKMSRNSESTEDQKTIDPDQPSPPQQIITYIGKMEDDGSESGVDENKASQKLEFIPEMTGISDSKLDTKTIEPDQLSPQQMEDHVFEPEPNENEDSQSNSIPQLAEISESNLDLNTIDPDQSGIENMSNSSPIVYETNTPQKKRLIDFLEFGKSGSGFGKIQSSPIKDDSSQNYSEIPESELLGIDSDPDQNITTFKPIEDVAFATQQSPITEVLEFGKSGSGCGKIQSSTIDDSSQKYPQLPAGSEFEKDEESCENEKSRVLKEKMDSLDVEDAGKALVDEKKDQSEALTFNLEKSEDPSSKNSENDKSSIQQKRVSDIKLLWEGGSPSQDATKLPVLSNTKRTSSPVELPVTPKSSSLDSDDQNPGSLVTFKKVMVEDEQDPMYPVDQLKSFWENEKNKGTTKEKPDREPMNNEVWSDNKGANTEHLRSKFKKWHTIHHFFNEEKSTDLMKQIPGRSVSLGENANVSLKEHIKSTSFQSLKNFWNTSSKPDNKGMNRALQENTKKQFGSNPDIRSKEPFVSRAKYRLAAKSLQDVREDPSAVSQIQVYSAETISEKLNNGNCKKEYTQNAADEMNSSSDSGGNDEFGKPIKSVNAMPQESSLPSNYSKNASTIPENCEPKQDIGIADEKQVLTDIMEQSVPPNKIAKSEFSLKLKTAKDEVSGTNFNLTSEGPQSPTFENYLENQNVYRDEENGEMNEKGRKMLLIKQNGFDFNSPEFSNVSGTLQQNEKNISEKETIRNEELSDSREVVNENIEKTDNPVKKDLSDFNRRLQKLYNESLNLDDSQTGNMTEPEYMDINEPNENFSKVLAISSGKNIQSAAGEKSHQPIIVNISSKKTELGNEDLIMTQPDGDTETSLINNTHDVPTVLGHLEQQVDISPSNARTYEEPTSELKGSLARDPEVEEFSSEPIDYKVTASHPEKQSKKEIIERIEMPVVLPPKTDFKYFDEKLKQLYEESQNSEPNLEETTNCDDVVENEKAGEPNKANVYLYSTDPKKTFLQQSSINLESSHTVSSDRETLTDESAPSDSQAPDILVQEVNEIIEKTVAPARISTAKRLEEFQKEDLNEEGGGSVGNVTFGHVALSDQERRKNSISETFPREKGTVQEETEAAIYEERNRVPSETSETSMSDRQSTPVKDKNGSLQRSTLELYLETPYRREISKSIDFDFSGYVPSEVNKYEGKLENQEDTLAPLENSFPENAEKFKRMSQSVPTFLQDDTDGRETDSASESSFQIGRHKKSPSSLTNLSGSSGMASMSSVSGSVMSVYSGDFGNVDIKGSIEYSIEYVEELKEFIIYIYQCKDLAAADVKKQRSDPYVKAYLLPEKAKMGKRKTAVKKKTLNPVYNEILKYKIPKTSLQAQTLNLSVWHRDVLGRNSFLGEVNQKLANWEWENKHKNWYPLEPRTPASSIGLERRGEMKLSLQYIPVSPSETGKKPTTTGEVHIWIRECMQLPMLRENKINSFVKCTILPDTSRKSRQKTRTVDKTPNPIFNHTMVYDGFKEDDLREACVELTVWDHNKLSNHFLGGIRIGQGTGKSYGTPVDWMDSSPEESTMWQKMIASPNTWIEGMLPLRMFKTAKLAK
ncbi:synaptotagmin-like protein 2 isoform 6-T6 [Anomaloglossus baeobatrachus]|uniref:synaptotagmin-like protein 2 isoform X6 n=1 Tax=Anomaloglossus baeobatrachus TaxID=238106 RepID=UPI003F5058D2